MVKIHIIIVSRQIFKNVSKQIKTHLRHIKTLLKQIKTFTKSIHINTI